MERIRRSPGVNVKKKKMTKEQMQLAIIKKKECDIKALTIVEKLLEPQVDSEWLLENLKNINRCHMEDAIEERAITKVCGYVLCQKPLTVIIKQQYHISLRDKKVYDVTKRKNFCSSSCFGASNYLLEQMFTSPLWLRDKEEIPKFRIFSRNKINQNSHPGEEVDISLVEPCINNLDCEKDLEANNKSKTKNQVNETVSNESTKEISNCIENFVLETVKNINFNDNKDLETLLKTDLAENDNELTVKTANKDYKLVQNDVAISKSNDDKHKDDQIVNKTHSILKKENETNKQSKCAEQNIVVHRNSLKNNTNIEQSMNEKNPKSSIGINVNEETNDSEDIVQHVYTLKQNKSKRNCEKSMNENPNAQNSINFKNKDHVGHIVRRVHFAKGQENEENGELHLEQKVSIQSTNNFENEKVLSAAISDIVTVNTNNMEKFKTKDVHEMDKNSDSERILSLSDSVEKSNKSRILKKKNRAETKPPVDINLAARIETSFHEWFTEETIDFLFGDDSIKKKVIEKIEHQDKYSILCEKLNRLQFQDEQEDDAILEKPTLKPAPHFAILKEEGEKLGIKVRAFYKGNTAIEEPQASVTNNETGNDNTVMPLTENHAPQIFRRKIFLEKLDQVIPDLLRTLAGNNDVYTQASANYTSVRCTAVKALINTFSLSAKNIIFKTAEWTLIGLVIIKMLSLLDPWLATLLVSKKANMYISMILTSYKLDPHYLNLFVASFNPNVNPK